jgi:hypothetical protein
MLFNLSHERALFCLKRSSPDQRVHEMGPRKLERGIKISCCGVKLEPAFKDRNPLTLSRVLQAFRSGSLCKPRQMADRMLSDI